MTLLLGRSSVRFGRASLLLLLLTVNACSKTDRTTEGVEERQAFSTLDVDAAAKSFCGACHSPPSPEMFARDDWPEEVRQGYAFYYESGRQDLVVPPMETIVNYYRERAPADIGPQPVTNVPSATVSFTAQQLSFADSATAPAVSCLIRSSDAPSQFYFGDMRSGLIRRVSIVDRQNVETEDICGVANPAHIELVDLDQDGRSELLVSDLGSFLPADHILGRVIWARPNAANEDWETVVLHEHLGRVADCRPADVDNDGDPDLIVAEFGWRQSGSILWLEQRSRQDGIPQFEAHRIDKRHGGIHVIPCDLNSDAWPDFISAISQEHEVVEAFVNSGNGRFTATTLFSANEPSYGTSGIEPCDLDDDGDLDILLTNGDSFDSDELCPAHSIQLLENLGTIDAADEAAKPGQQPVTGAPEPFRFRRKELTRLPGAHRALPADVDGDGDLDIVACAFLPESLRTRYPGDFDGLIWLEQTDEDHFVRHQISDAVPEHVALNVGDFDGDGRIDIAAGRFSFDAAHRGAVTILWNDAIARNRDIGR